MSKFLANDVARCDGYSSIEDGVQYWREGCETCMRRTAPRTATRPDDGGTGNHHQLFREHKRSAMTTARTEPESQTDVKLSALAVPPRSALKRFGSSRCRIFGKPKHDCTNWQWGTCPHECRNPKDK